MLDIKTEIPCYRHITDGKVHEVNILDRIVYQAGGFYIRDRAYVDWEDSVTFMKIKHILSLVQKST